MRTLQRQIIAELGSRPSVDAAEEIEQRSQFLATYLAQSGMNGYVLGVSGGQDSLLAGMLAQRAVEIQRANGQAAEFHAVLLPYGTQSDRADALLALDTIGPDARHDINIQSATDAFVDTFWQAEHQPLTDFNKGNVKARLRMIAHYALAGQHGLLVIGTDHAAEAITGFYTKYGDGGADVLPLAGLTKRQGKQLLHELHVPSVFIEKTPTADLLDAKPGQPDEAELALSYDVLDDYLEGRVVSAQDAAAIEARFLASRHKRTMPVAYSHQRDMIVS